MVANKMAKPNDVQSYNEGCNSGKRRCGFSSGKNTFKSPTEGLQHVIFDYSASKNNNNMLVDNAKKLIHHIDVSGAIRYDKSTVTYAVRTLTSPVFEVPAKLKKYYKGGYGELDLRGYLSKAKEVEQNKNTWTKNNQVM